MPSSRPSTTPHHPNYGVQLSTETIKRIVLQALPGATITGVESLASLKSFNNRIYYINCFAQDDGIEHALKTVLKVNGRGFGPAKIQNEVSCLRSLENFCPKIPVPRVIAWSQDGLIIETDCTDRVAQGIPGGWILMTRVPGEPIDLSKIDDNVKRNLAIQLADHVTNWRRNVPHQMYAGNIRFERNLCDIHSYVQDQSPLTQEFKGVRPDITLSNLHGTEATDLVIRGMLGEGLEHPEGIATFANYWTFRVQNKLKILKTDKTLTSNQSLIASVQLFIDKVLPNLSALKTEADTFVFTHYDLSPRNVLISDEPPRITGIVDFEFSGFFPSLDEFLNDYVGNKDDWPKDMYEVYLKRLEENGIPTPLKGIEKEFWIQMSLLEELVQNIAPWWLNEGFKKEELKQELDKAKSIVEEILAKLNS